MLGARHCCSTTPASLTIRRRRSPRSPVSRVDLHIDWQGGFIPSYSAGEDRRFIRPRRTLWHPFNEGNTCLGLSLRQRQTTHGAPLQQDRRAQETP